MQSEFAKIRTRLSKIAHNRDLREDIKKRRLYDRNSVNHIPLSSLPTRYHNENWARELRCSILPWMLWGEIKDEKYLLTQMRNVAWKSLTLDDDGTDGEHDPNIGYKVFTCEAAADWDRLELVYLLKNDGIVLKNAILHKSITK